LLLASLCSFYAKAQPRQATVDILSNYWITPNITYRQSGCFQRHMAIFAQAGCNGLIASTDCEFAAKLAGFISKLCSPG